MESCFVHLSLGILSRGGVEMARPRDTCSIRLLSFGLVFAMLARLDFLLHSLSLILGPERLSMSAHPLTLLNTFKSPENTKRTSVDLYIKNNTKIDLK